MTDLAVCGGGPAGLAVAIRARLAGLDVVVLDAARPPVDKACGEGLMPDAVELLERLGVAVPEGRRHAFHGIRWIDGDVVVEGAFPDRPGWGVRRTDLHAAMVRRAVTLGADLRWGVRVHGLLAAGPGDGGPDGAGYATDAGPVWARYVVAADGLRSPLRKAAGLEGRPARHRRLALRRHYAVAPWSDLVEVYWSDGAEAYVTPIGADQVGVAMLFEGLRPDFDRLLARFPALARRIGSAPIASRPRGAGPLERRAAAVVRGPLALVGDAAGYVDAITGEGLAIAFRDAMALVESIERGRGLDGFAAARRRQVLLPEGMTRLLLAVERRPRLRRRVMRALASDPAIFRGLLAVHVRRRAAPAAAAWILLRLAWDLVFATGGGGAGEPEGTTRDAADRVRGGSR
jgi:flavin-dependent dehydrogenase